MTYIQLQMYLFTVVQSAVPVLRLHVVCPSDCLSVTLVDQDHICWKSWKLIARTISPTSSLFVAQRPSTYSSQSNIGKFGETRGMGWGKVACWSTKAAMRHISETRKDRWKVTMEGL